MPENKPPVYSWTVGLADSSTSFTVDAAYPVIDDGHMLLKDSDHKIVFAAAPGAGCTFTRAGLAATSEPGVTVKVHAGGGLVMGDADIAKLTEKIGRNLGLKRGDDGSAVLGR